MTDRINELNQIAFKILKNHDKAEDAVQTALLSFLESYPETNFQSPEAMPLLVTILKNQIIDDTRKKREVVFSDLETEDDHGEVVSYEPAGTYGDVNYDDVLTIIRSLTPKLRQAADLIYLKGLTYSEAARAIGITEAALTSRIHKAKTIIKKELED